MTIGSAEKLLLEDGQRSTPIALRVDGVAQSLDLKSGREFGPHVVPEGIIEAEEEPEVKPRINL